MSTCVSIGDTGQLVAVQPQPADLTTCQLVVMTPVEFSNATQVADPAQAAEFFSFGFSMVVVSYLAGLAVGSVLRVVRQAR